MRRAAACLISLLTVGVVGPAAQTWKAAALASFDTVWQTVDDTFYDPTFGGVDWSAVKAELRPKVEAAASPDDVRRTIAEMLGRLHRSHFVLLSSSPAASDENVVVGAAVVPMDVRVTDLGGAPALVVVDVRTKAPSPGGVRPGEIVERIGDEDVGTWGANVPTTEDARARHFDIWRRAIRALHGSPGSHVSLTVKDLSAGSAARVVDAVREPEAGEVQTFGNLPPLTVRTEAREVTSPGGRRVGVIAFNYWMASVDAPFAAAVDRFRARPGLVIDLRGNPGGLAAMIRGVAGHFFDADVLLGRMQTRAGTLQFTANPRLSTPDGRRVAPYAGPVAILVDELTASASECFAGALQSLGRARIFGRQTMGQALPASTKGLPDGDVLMYAVGDFVTSTGQRLEGPGVVPDVVVPLEPATISALSAGRDPVLDAALQWIDAQGRRRGSWN